MADQIHKFIPISSITENLIISGGGDLTFGFEIFLPEIFTIDYEGQEKFHHDLIGIFRNLPNNSTIHSQTFVYKDSNPIFYKNSDTITFRHDLKKFEHDIIQRCRTFIYITIPASKKTLFYGVKDYLKHQPFTDVEASIVYIRDILNDTLNRLNSLKDNVSNFETKLLSNDELERNVIASATANPNIESDLYFDEYNTRQSHNSKLYLSIGNRYVSTIMQQGEGLENFVLKQHNKINFDDTQEFTTNIVANANRNSFSFPLTLGMQFEHIYNFYFTIKSIEDIDKDLKKNFAYYHVLDAFKLPSATHKINQVKIFLDYITVNLKTPCLFCSNVIVSDIDLLKLSKKESLVSQTYTNINGSPALADRFMQFGNLIKSIPGLARYHENNLISYLETALCYLPKENNYTSDPTGYIYGDRSGALVKINLDSSKYQVAKNGVVIGPTGSGKSVWVNSKVAQDLSIGKQVIIIDKGGSYKRLSAINNGFYINSNDRKQLSFNIFACKKDFDGKYLYYDIEDKEDSNYQIIFLVTIFNYLWKQNEELTPIENSFLNSILASFYDHVNENKIHPTMDEFYSYIDLFAKTPNGVKFKNYVDYTAFSIILEDFTFLHSGTYQFLLNKPDDKDQEALTNHNLSIFDLQGIEGDKRLIELVIILSLNKIEKAIANNFSIQKSIYIDEAVDYLTGRSGSFIGAWYRKIRKRNGQIIIAAQSISFLDDIDPLVKSSILANCDIKVLLSHKGKETEHPKLIQNLGLTKHSISLLESLEINDAAGFREFLLIIGNYPRVFRYHPSALTMLAYSTTPKDIQQIENNFLKSNNYEQSIYQTLEDRNIPIF